MYACYVVFNNEPTIRESLESVLPYVEKVIAIDGAYARFPHKKPWSTDSTKEIFHKLCGNKLIWVGCKGKAWPTQIVKRNEYVNRVPNGKGFLVIDGDTMIKGKIREGLKLVEALNHICIGIKHVNYVPIWDGPYADSGRHKYALIPRDAWKNVKWREYYGVIPCLYKKLKGMRYSKHHSRVYVGNRVVTRPKIALWDVSMVNLNYRMGWERWQANLIYKTTVKTH